MDAIPERLRALPWVAWRWVPRDDGGWKKTPFQIGWPQAEASNSNPAHARNEGDAREVQIMAPELFDGYGVVLSEAAGLVFIDLDDVRDPDTGEVDLWAQQLVDVFNSFAEVSASGTGVHVFCGGRLPGPGLNSFLDGDGAQRIEVYDRGRFAFLTGH